MEEIRDNCHPPALKGINVTRRYGGGGRGDGCCEDDDTTNRIKRITNELRKELPHY
jgi:hypothetical protein